MSKWRFDNTGFSVLADTRDRDIMLQPFDRDGKLLCAACMKPISHGQFFVEVRQRDDVDQDSRLAVHVGCLGNLT